MTAKLKADKDFTTSTDRRPAYNSTYKKLAVQWLNEAISLVSSFVVADSLVLRHRQLLVAANRLLFIKALSPLAIALLKLSPY